MQDNNIISDNLVSWDYVHIIDAWYIILSKNAERRLCYSFPVVLTVNDTLSNKYLVISNILELELHIDRSLNTV